MVIAATMLRGERRSGRAEKTIPPCALSRSIERYQATTTLHGAQDAARYMTA